MVKAALLLGCCQNCVVSNFVLLPIREFSIRHLLLLRDINTIRRFVAARMKLTAVRDHLFVVTFRYSRKDPMILVPDDKVFLTNIVLNSERPR